MSTLALSTILFTVCINNGPCENHAVQAWMPPIQCQMGMVVGEIVSQYRFTSQHKLTKYRCEAK